MSKRVQFFKFYLRILISIVLVMFLSSCEWFDSFREKHIENVKELTYTISPEFKGDLASIKITLEFVADETGKTTLIVPLRWTSRGDKLYTSIENLEIYTSQKTLVFYKKIKDSETKSKVSDGGTYLLPSITVEPGERVYVKYSTKPSQYFDSRRQNIDKNYFHFIGRTTLIHPNIDVDQKIKVILSWKNLPENWKLANSHGVNEFHQALNLPFKYVKEGIYVGGDFKIHKILVENQPVFIASRGSWSFSDQKFSDEISSIIKAQREFFNDFDFPYYLVVLLPTGGEVSFGGDGLHNSFQMYMPERTGLKAIAWLISHEHFHTWNGERMKLPKNYLEVKWFSEGFTEYYANLFTFRLGIIPFQDFIKNINEKFYHYFTSPVRNEPNSRIIKGSGQDRNVNYLPYFRGELLALHWTTQIKKHTQRKHSLDDIMLDIFEVTQKNNVNFSTQLFGRLMQKYYGNNIWDEIEKYVQNGETLIPDKDAFGKCCQLTWKKMKNTDFGFNKHKSRKKKVISEVDKSGPAFKAGLRDGQILLDITTRAAGKLFEIEVTQLSKIKIKDLDGTVKTIEFYPKGKEEFDVPQYVLDKDYFEKYKEECLAWFGINEYK